MDHPIYRVISVTIVADYTLKIEFNDNSEQIIDFRPILDGQIYGSLKDLSLFNRVSIDPEVHTIVWPNGADFDPATLHDWPQHKEIFEAKIAQWDKVSA